MYRSVCAQRVDSLVLMMEKTSCTYVGGCGLIIVHFMLELVVRPNTLLQIVHVGYKNIIYFFNLKYKKMEKNIELSHKEFAFS